MESAQEWTGVKPVSLVQSAPSVEPVLQLAHDWQFEGRLQSQLAGMKTKQGCASLGKPLAMSLIGAKGMGSSCPALLRDHI